MPEVNGEKVTLKEYIDWRFSELEKRLTSESRLNEIAINKATNTIDDRLALMNEFRGQMKDRETAFATRSEMKSLEKAIEDLRLSRAELAGKASQKSVDTALLMSLVGLLLGIISFVMRL